LADVSSDFYERLDARVRDVENSVRGLRAELDASRALAADAVAQPAPPAAPEPVVPQPVAAGSDPAWPTYEQMFGKPPPVRRARGPRLSFETLLAGRAMPIAGLLLVLLATAFFLDQAFRNGWIGPPQRILLGLVAGTVLIYVAARRVGAEYLFLAEGLIGLGAGILYLSLWASVAKFPELHVPRLAAFAAMIVVTAVLSALAIRRRSQRLALMGMFGGFITPVLLASGTPERAGLAAYLLMLSGAMLWVSVRSSFRWVEAVTFVAVVCYTPAFAFDRFNHWGETQAATVAALFFAVFATAFTLGALRDGVASTARVVLLTCDTVLFGLVLELIFDAKQTTLGLSLLVLAAALLAATRIPALPRRMQFAYGYLGVAAVTLAIPALFHANGIVDMFAVEAGLLVAIGALNGDHRLQFAGALLFAATAVPLLGQAASDPPHRTVLNSLSLGFVVYLAALGFAMSRYAASGAVTRVERGWRNVAIVVWNVVALAALSRECVDLLGGPKGLDDLANEAQFGLSAIWTIYATVLFALGMSRHVGLLRWLGLILFGCTIFKVFVVDLAALIVMYRILSFFVLGVVLVAVSLWYQRTMVRQKAAEAPEPAPEPAP
jgi:uncharacterized membrane protein